MTNIIFWKMWCEREDALQRVQIALPSSTSSQLYGKHCGGDVPLSALGDRVGRWFLQQLLLKERQQRCRMRKATVSSCAWINAPQPNRRHLHRESSDSSDIHSTLQYASGVQGGEDLWDSRHEFIIHNTVQHLSIMSCREKKIWITTEVTCYQLVRRFSLRGTKNTAVTCPCHFLPLMEQSAAN